MLKDLTYSFILFLARIHDGALTLNDRRDMGLTDKDLHFWFFGVAGALAFLLAWLLFKWLRRYPGVLAWLFSFVLMLMSALAVEVGQWATGTGAMQFKDIAAGMIGHTVFSLAAAAVIGACAFLRR